jgi:transposase InsO family protein
MRSACADSFFHSLKIEIINGERFVSRAGLKPTAFEYIEIDHNRVRRHSANGCLSREAFEAHRVA